MRRPMMVFGALVATVTLSHAQLVDGRNIPSKYPAPLAAQTNYTGFGDHVPGVDYGSELNQL
ncbi:MAG: hypothetical protein NZ874_10160, partial [Fimbriimonadales bacterium]|nr:hypothetical protein [Fimbriimonadales bacterium]